MRKFITEEMMVQCAPVLLRVTMSLVFLWFGTQQLMNAEAWTGFLPPWTGMSGLGDVTFIQLNGWLEVVLGVMLGIGLQTRFVATVLGLHLFGIAASVGGATGVRDAGLALATLSIALAGADTVTLDAKLATHRQK